MVSNSKRQHTNLSYGAVLKGPSSTDRLFDRFHYGNPHCLTWQSDEMNFSFGGIFIYENCSTARNGFRLKLGLKLHQII